MRVHDIVTLSPLKIVGSAILTSNEKEESNDRQIVELYEHFIHKQVSSKIQNKKNDRVIAIYTDYESDESGEYIYALGHEVTSDECPNDLEFFDIPKLRYLHFSSENGYLNEVLPRLWREIWRLSQAGELGAERSYEADLEFHNYSDNTQADVQVDIYLSVR